MFLPSRIGYMPAISGSDIGGSWITSHITFSLQTFVQRANVHYAIEYEKRYIGLYIVFVRHGKTKSDNVIFKRISLYYCF